jgi:hypothetical protein
MKAVIARNENDVAIQATVEQAATLYGLPRRRKRLLAMTNLP